MVTEVQIMAYKCTDCEQIILDPVEAKRHDRYLVPQTKEFLYQVGEELWVDMRGFHEPDVQRVEVVRRYRSPLTHANVYDLKIRSPVFKHKKTPGCLEYHLSRDKPTSPIRK